MRPTDRRIDRSTARAGFRWVALGALLVALLLAPADAIAQAPTTGWTQYQANAAHTGAVADGPAPAFEEVWSLGEPIGGSTGTEGLSPAVISQGLAVTASPDALIAVDAATGAEAWRIDRAAGPPVPPAIVDAGDDALVVYAEGSGPNPPTGSPATSPSPAPTPSPSPAGNDGSTAALVAVRLDDGTEEWRTELPSPSRSGVTAADDAVYVGTNDGALTALEASTGAIRWREQVGGTVVAPAAVEGDLVVVTAAGDADAQLVVAALRADDGSTAWRYEPGLGMRIGGPPSIADGAVFVGLEDRTVRAIDLESGSERWSARLNVPSPLTAPAVASEVVLVVDLGGQVYALDGATGERRWDHALNVRVRWSSPVVSGEAVLVASVDGRLFALDLVEGDLLSSLDAADGVLRSLVVGDDRVIAVRSGSEPGLVAFAHDPDGSLVRIASPTIVDPARLAANAALAIVPIVVVLLVLGRWLARRSGPPPLGGIRPRDPIEDALAEDEP